MNERNKKLFMPGIVLASICVIVAALLGGVNELTKDRIAANKLAAENAAFAEIYPGASGYPQVNDLPAELPANVTAVYDCGDGGYIFSVSVKGYSSFSILVGVDPEGKITGAKEIESGETYGFEDELNKAYNGVSWDNLTLIIATGATSGSDTSEAYFDAMQSSLKAFAIMGGGSVRTDKEIRDDEGNALLGTEGLSFTEWIAHNGVANADKLYVTDSGEALIVLGEGDEKVYIAYAADGSCANADAIPAADADTVSALYNAFSASFFDRAELTALGVTSQNVLQVGLNADGSYTLVVQAKGYAEFEYSGVTDPIVIKTTIGADGAIISNQTLSHGESAGYGAVCAEPEYYEKYNGKTADTYNSVDAITGSTYTSNGYKKAVKLAFTTYEKLTAGGETNE